MMYNLSGKSRNHTEERRNGHEKRSCDPVPPGRRRTDAIDMVDRCGRGMAGNMRTENGDG